MIAPSATPLGAARERERGQVLVLFAFVLIALLLVSALAVDYGGWLLARRSYQNIADEAAIAGAYLLTSPTGADCTQGPGISKQHCAREAAWTSIKAHTGLTALAPATQANSIGNAPYAEAGYRIWVASPPSDAGSAYPGLASSSKTIFVRVERDLSANLSRIVKSSTTVGAWATAGRIAENFAILTLCGPPTCVPSNGDNVKVNGTGSNLVLESGDLGSNSFGKTSGNSASIALCQGSAVASECSAYMHYPAQCAIGSVSCQIDTWTGSAVDTATLHSALALPQVIDPFYNQPGCLATSNNCTPSSTYVPYQCYSTSDTPPAITMGSDPFADAHDSKELPILLTSAVQPPTEPPILLGANVTVGGKVTGTAGAGGGNLGGIKVTLTAGGYNDTSSGAGTYSVKNVPSGANYTLTATDATGTYHTYTQATGVIPAGGATINFSMDKNPIITGIVRDSSFVGISGATVYLTLGATTWTTLSGAGGAYSITAQPPAGAGPWTFSTYASASGYASDAPYSVTANVNTTTPNQHHTLTANPGSISGTVTSGGSPLAGVGVTSSSGGTPGLTDALGKYTISGVPAGITTVTASKAGYNSVSQSVTVPPGGTVTNINFALILSATITGQITDDTTGLALSGATVTVSTGPSSGDSPRTTDSTGHYTITGVVNGNYRIQASLSGYTTGVSANTSVSGTMTINLSLWPDRCGTSNNSKGKWDCGNGTGGCPAVTNPSAVNVSCASFDSTNRIRPGTYKDITISSGQCAWIDPLGGTPGLTSGQKAGIVYVTDNISIGSNAFLFGDGVTIVVSKDASVDVNNSGGFVLNYQDTARTYNGSNWRTGSYIGGTGVTYCSGDADHYADLRKGAWTTKTRYVWDQTMTPPCYDDLGSNTTTYKGEIGMTWFLRGTPPNSNSHRFDLSGLMGFLFDGVLYGPKDDIGLGGQGAQAAAGQIVAWTLTYSGNTDIHQRFSGLEIDGPPYLIEPYIGE
jgi:hypothetical protein